MAVASAHAQGPLRCVKTLGSRLAAGLSAYAVGKQLGIDPHSLRPLAQLQAYTTVTNTLRQTGSCASRSVTTPHRRKATATSAYARNVRARGSTNTAKNARPVLAPATRFIPKEKGVVLGLISSKTPVLETIDSLRRRVDEATKYMVPERLASPQCGFASSAGGNPLTKRDERTKLRLAVDA